MSRLVYSSCFIWVVSSSVSLENSVLFFFKISYFHIKDNQTHLSAGDSGAIGEEDSTASLGIWNKKFKKKYKKYIELNAKVKTKINHITTHIIEDGTFVARLIFFLFGQRSLHYLLPILFVLSIGPLQLENLYLTGCGMQSLRGVASLRSRVGFYLDSKRNPLFATMLLRGKFCTDTVDLWKNTSANIYLHNETNAVE